MPSRPSQGAVPPLPPLPPVPRVWSLRSPDLAEHASGVAGVVERLLALRGVSEQARPRWLNPSLRDLPDPDTMIDMTRAVSRLCDALSRRERIVVHGDYDVDGCTSTALLVRFLDSVGGNVGWYAPHRVRDGYGIQAATMRRLASEGARVVITCDNGTSAHEAIEAGNDAGVDTIVVDHHRLPPSLPAAAAILNPKRDPPGNPFEDLAAVGVAFFLAVALRAELRRRGQFDSTPEPDLREHLEVVALGTVADLAPLVGPNRVLVAAGLKCLGARRHVGLTALLEVAKIEPEETLLASHLGFQLGPRINAAGRLDEAARAVEVLLAADLGSARLLAEDLDAVNRRRKDLERAVFADCLRALQAAPPTARGGVVLWSGDWHPGVIGIVAAQVCRHVHRPTLLFSVRDGIAVGSGRALPGIDLFDVLTRHSHLLLRYGGHRAAAGVTISEDRLPELRAAFADGAFHDAADSVWEPVLHADAELDLADVTWELFAGLERLAPFGLGNAEPTFLARNLLPTGVRVLGDGVGIRLRLRGDHGPPLTAVGFGLAPPHPGINRVDALFTLQANQWQGRRSLELRLRDLRTSDGQVPG